MQGITSVPCNCSPPDFWCYTNKDHSLLSALLCVFIQGDVKGPQLRLNSPDNFVGMFYQCPGRNSFSTTFPAENRKWKGQKAWCEIEWSFFQWRWRIYLTVWEQIRNWQCVNKELLALSQLMFQRGYLYPCSNTANKQQVADNWCK